jgi:hypothetical protein
MGPRVYIDREKHEVDVTEHVLEGGVHTEVDRSARDHVVAVDRALSPWSLGVVASDVHVTVLAEPEGATEWSDRRRREDDRKR